jgi:nucleoside-diphosphate-sugar epimerase
MRVFVTGATGFIGSAVVDDLIAAGHQVLGLTRSDAGAQALAAAGAQAWRGSLEDLDSLRRGADQADGVIHTAFNHDFSTYVANCEADRTVIEALGSVLVGSDRPLVVTSGTGMGGAPGRLFTEADPPASARDAPRAASEEAAAALDGQGVNVSVMRLPQVHDPEKQGFVTFAIAAAREKGVSAYIGEGRNRWPAAHRLDTARAYRLALEKAEQGARYHAVAEEGVSMRDIAEAIGRRLRIPVAAIAPEAAPDHFGWLAAFAIRDLPASSALTRERLGWRPSGPGLIADLDAGTDGGPR